MNYWWWICAVSQIWSCDSLSSLISWCPLEALGCYDLLLNGPFNKLFPYWNQDVWPPQNLHTQRIVQILSENLFGQASSIQDKFLEGISTRRGRLYIFLHLWAINVKIEELYCPELEHQISAVVASVLLMQADTNLYMRQNWQFHSLNKFVIRIIRQAGVCI